MGISRSSEPCFMSWMAAVDLDVGHRQGKGGNGAWRGPFDAELCVETHFGA